MEQILANIDQRIANIDERIANGQGNADLLQQRKEGLLKRKQDIQSGNFNPQPNVTALPAQLEGNMQTHRLEMLKRQRDNIQSRLDAINTQISTLEAEAAPVE